MRILCAPDSFKGSLAANDVARAMEVGICSLERTEVVVGRHPLADGGEGTASVLASALDGQWIEDVMVQDPCGRLVAARFFLEKENRRAVLDLATASGLSFVQADDIDITRRSTFGTGELMRAAMQCASDEIIIGMGGSATCDAGVGILQALGARLEGKHGSIMSTPTAPCDLHNIARIDPPTVRHRIRVAADVKNVLLGAEGTARVYGPQKGATSDQVAFLDQVLEDFAALTPCDTEMQYGGAAGGAAFGLAAWTGASLESGIDLVCDCTDFVGALRNADLVLTGEGRFDSQSSSGKTVSGVIQRAAAANVPVALIAGMIDPDASCDAFVKTLSLAETFGAQHAMANAATCIQLGAATLVNQYLTPTQ